MDALASFTHLTENVPLWLTKLEALSAQVAEQHAKFSRLTAATEIKLARQKTGSTESLRPQEEEAAIEEDQPQHASVTPNTSAPLPSALQNTANDVLAIKEARRKRKPGSALSAASGPQKYRSRSMIIVYYDSDIQDAFQLLVRNIAGARNNLRKGRAAVDFKKRMASLGVGTPLFSSGGEPGLDFKSARSTKQSTIDTDYTGPGPVFDLIDKDLENAHILCERAAHQMLREGDCKEELLGTKYGFQNSLKLAEKEVERLRAEEAQEVLEEPSPKDATLVELEEKVTPPSVKPIEFAGIGAIEVDDISDAESIHIDLSAIRRTRRL